MIIINWVQECIGIHINVYRCVFNVCISPIVSHCENWKLDFRLITDDDTWVASIIRFQQCTNMHSNTRFSSQWEQDEEKKTENNSIFPSSRLFVCSSVFKRSMLHAFPRRIYDTSTHEEWKEKKIGSISFYLPHFPILQTISEFRASSHAWHDVNVFIANNSIKTIFNAHSISHSHFYFLENFSTHSTYISSWLITYWWWMHT